MAKSHKRKVKSTTRQTPPPTPCAPAFQEASGGDRVSGDGDILTAVTKGKSPPMNSHATTADGVSSTMPDGAPTSSRKDYTPLQQHVLFWDRDADGQIYPWDTYTGFRELGFNILFSLLAVVLINGSLSYPTRLAVSWWPDWVWWRVWVGGIHKAKHGSDSGVYDKEGGFVKEMFEEMYERWDVHGSGSLSAGELWRMVKRNRLAADPFGWAAAVLEFGTTWLMVQQDGRVSKEDLRQTYDGSIFWKIKEAREQDKGWNKGFGLRDFIALGQRELKGRVL